MTRFLLSHNRQIDAPELPPITAQQLAAGLRRHWGDGLEAMPLEHPHWMVALQADQTAEAMAERLLQAWRALRPGNGQGAQPCSINCWPWGPQGPACSPGCCTPMGRLGR